MKIAISGAHGVGKTQLARKLAEALGLPIIDEVARTVAQQMGIKSCADILAQLDAGKWGAVLKYQHKIITAQIQAERATDWISDRSVMDIAGYIHLYATLIADKKQRKSALIDAKTYSEGIMPLTRKYDAIVYVPVPRGLQAAEDDGFRLTAYQAELDKILRGLLKKAECMVIRLPRVDVGERDKWVDYAIRRIDNVKKMGKTVRRRDSEG